MDIRGWHIQRESAVDRIDVGLEAVNVMDDGGDRVIIMRIGGRMGSSRYIVLTR
jgi:hypothetical protein